MNGGPDPPDTGQIIQTAALIRGAYNIINGVDDVLMETGDPFTSTAVTTGNKRPFNETSQDEIHKSKQPTIKVSETTSEPASDVTHQNKQKNTYKITDAGPYFIFVEQKEGKKLHPMTVGKILYKGETQVKDNILNITSVGKSKIKILLNNAIIANKLLFLPSLNNNIFDSYIPDFNLYKYGVVRDIDTSITIEEIINETNSNIKIIEARRLTKRLKVDGQVEYRQLETCVLKFEGQILPNHIYLFGTRCEVSTYIPPVVQCFNCLRYGHMSKQCKSKQRCSRCQDSHAPKDCSASVPICLYCKGEHSSIYRQCPEFTKQKNIKKIMTLNNISFKEATKAHNDSFSTVASKNLPIMDRDKEFPTLSYKPRPPTISHINQKKHTNFTKIVQPKSNTLIQNTQKNVNLPSTQNVSLPIKPIGPNPYPPQYHRNQQETPEMSHFSKDKLIELIETIIQATQNSNNFSKTDISYLLDSLNKSLTLKETVQNGY